MTSPLAVGMKRTAEMAAIFMIGDGLLGLLQPTRHVDLWRSQWNGSTFLYDVSMADRLDVGFTVCFKSPLVSDRRPLS